MKKVIFLLTFMIFNHFAFSQKGNVLEWSSTKRLELKDFNIVATDSLSNHCGFGNYINLKGGPIFSMGKKNYNKCVSNLMSTSVSWIDTAYDIAGQIRFMQTVFDISEIYSRLIRKALTEKGSTTSKTFKSVQEQYIPQFVARKDTYEKETKGGTNIEKQIRWEKTIAQELEELKEFSRE
jgi:hypothetical protein